jgi:glucokinase
LGESFLTWNGSQYVAHSSEGGHSDFAPTDERQIGLLQYLLRRVDHVAVERVCSGIGVPNIYDYLRDEEQIPERPDVARVAASARDRTRAIVDAATDSDNPSALCRATIEMLVAILASEAGNLPDSKTWKSLWPRHRHEPDVSCLYVARHGENACTASGGPHVRGRVRRRA